MRFKAGVVISMGLVFLNLVAPTCLIAEGVAGKDTGNKRMTMTQAVLLGAVEGLTEYLPVSSTGHLLVAERLMGLEKESTSPTLDDKRSKTAADAYTICIQAGAILAVVWLYFGRIKQIGRGILGQDREGLVMMINVVAAFLPAAIVGLLFNNAIKTHLFGIWPVISAWFLGGLAILVVVHFNSRSGKSMRAGRTLDQLRIKMALIIGFVQCIAMWPGVSRSLVTIVGGILVGLSLPAAVEFSFLLGLLTLGAATGYDFLKHGQLMLQTFDGLSLLIGLLSAFLFAVFSIKWMVGYLSRHSLAIFGYYRVLAAIAGAALLLT
jgi:undecaprenyl-diphosphatase